MKIKAGRIPTIYAVLGKLINEKRSLPTKGKYRVGRLFDAFSKEAERFEKERSDLVKKYGEEVFAKDEAGNDKLDADGKKMPAGWQVPPVKLAEFQVEFVKLIEGEIEVSCQPIPLSQLEAPASVESITTEEFLILGDLVMDDEVPA